MPCDPNREDRFYIPNIVNTVNRLVTYLCVYTSETVQSIEQLSLYNRWGNRVLGPISGNTESVCFPATSMTNLTSGVYVYRLSVRFIDGSLRTFGGDVTIL